MRLYGLIGFPLGHSFSEQYFTEKFSRERLEDCIFKAFPITSIDQLPALLQANPLLKGLSVTIPYKQQALQYISELSAEVIDIGATNSIKISGNKLIAYNTDIPGFKKSFGQLLQPHHCKALVLGTGGASKAVQYVLKKMNFDFIVVSRKQQPTHNVIQYDLLSEKLVHEYNVIINCTPCGMWPNEQECPQLPYQFLTPLHYVFDLVYKPSKTLLLQKAEAAGAIIKNGMDMLIIQAEESWILWNE